MYVGMNETTATETINTWRTEKKRDVVIDADSKLKVEREKKTNQDGYVIYHLRVRYDGNIIADFDECVVGLDTFIFADDNNTDSVELNDAKHYDGKLLFMRSGRKE